MNLFSLLRRRYADHPERVCLELPGGEQWTYGELDKLAARFAAVLRRAGAEPGERVMVQVEKSAAAVALYLGALRCGAVYIPLNTGYTTQEVAFFLADAKPRVLVCEPASEATLRAAAAAGGARILALGTTPASPLWREARASEPDPEIEPRAGDDLAAIVYTSGTTGRSKGAMLSHDNLISNALALHELWGFRPGDVLLHPLPIFHLHGLFVALHTALLNASRILFLPHFDVVDVRWGLHRATVAMGVPTFYTRLLQDASFDRAACTGMRLFISGSAPLSPETHRRFEERAGHRILERYGMTEAGMITSNPLDGERVAGTVGFALPEVEVRVADEDGKVLPPGEVGVLEVRGPNVFRGYWQAPEATARELRDDGFFVTGDLATIDDEGRVTLVGRAKDLIISGGYNIYPKEIETCLDRVPGVAESAVVGVPHPYLGEGVVAVLVAERGAEVDHEGIQRRLDAELARFKHPRRFFWIESLPRNAMGKVQKNLLRREHRDAYGAPPG